MDPSQTLGRDRAPARVRVRTPQDYSIRRVRRDPTRPRSRVAPAWPDLGLTLPLVPLWGESGPPAAGLGLLLPYTPPELRSLVHAYGPYEIEIEFFQKVRARWAGVTAGEVRDTLRARLWGRWLHWGPFPACLEF